jgi:pimeloyl-ACP methyl ester carboxylesterase
MPRVSVPDATHFINLDEPELFNSTLLDFLARWPRPRRV